MVDLQFSDAGLAAFYDTLSPRQERGDFGFYLPLALESSAVLDVGCGTGSFLREVREVGHPGRLCGLDPAAGMIAQARQFDGVEWRQGVLPSAGFRAAFDLIVMTGHAFQVLLADDDIRGFLHAVQVAVKPGGRFAFETRNPAARAWEGWDGYRWPTVAGPDGPVTVTCRVERTFDGHLVGFTQTYACPAWPAPRISPSTLRFVDAPILDALLGEAGLEVAARYGDWDRSPLRPTSPEIITVARRI